MLLLPGSKAEVTYNVPFSLNDSFGVEKRMAFSFVVSMRDFKIGLKSSFRKSLFFKISKLLSLKIKKQIQN